MATTTESPSSEQVRIQLFTRQPDLELNGIGPILVSTKLSRLDLSNLINQLLEREKPIALEILINGTFLRTSIESFLTQHGISAETSLSVEYTRALLPPSYQTSFEHDDWIGAVDILSPTSPAGRWSSQDLSSTSARILTASFDGLLRVWNPSGNITAISSPCSTTAPVQSIYSARFLDSERIVSSGLGVPIRIWSYSENEPDDGPNPNVRGILTPQLDLFGHKSASNCLAVHTPTQHILSASDDGTIALFSSSSEPSDQPAAPPHFLSPVPHMSAKRRKLSHPTPPSTVPRAGPLTTLSAHVGPATSVIFHPTDASAAYSASRDRTLRTWDLVTSAAVTSRTPSPGSQVSCLAAVHGLGLLAAGTVGRTVCLVDPRADSRTARSAVLTLSGFRLPVSCVAADPSPGREFAVAGGSHDGTVRVFDVRGANGGAVAELGVDGIAGMGRTASEAYKIVRCTDGKCERRPGGEGVKVLGLAWDEMIGLCSAGEDKMLQIDRAE